MAEQGNNVVEFILRLRQEGTGQARQFAVELSRLQGGAGQVASGLVRAGDGGRQFANAIAKGPGLAQQFSQSLLALNGSLGIVAGSLGAGIGIGAIIGLARATAEAAREQQFLADTLGTNIKEASRLSYAVQKTGGDINNLRAYALFASQALDEALGNRKSRPAQGFRALGIEPAEVKDLYDLLLKLADAYKNSALPQEEKLLALREILGRQARALLPLLKDGADGIKRFGDAAEKAGVVIDESMAKNLAKFRGELAHVQNLLKSKIGLPVAEFAAQNEELTLLLAHLGLVAGAIGILKQFGVFTAFVGLTRGAIEAIKWLGLLVPAMSGAGNAAFNLSALLAGSAAKTGFLGAAIAVTVGLLVTDAKVTWDIVRAKRELNRALEDEAALRKRAAAQFASEAKTEEQQLVRQLNTLDQELQKLFLKREEMREAARMLGGAGPEAGGELPPSTGPETDPQIIKIQKTIDGLRARLREIRAEQERDTAEAARTARAILPDPKETGAAWQRVLEVEQSALETRDAQRRLAVAQGQATERDALDQRYQDLLWQNHLELAAARELQQQEEVLAAAFRAGDKRVSEERADEAVRQAADLQTKLDVLYAQRDKLRAEATAAGFDLDRKLWEQQAKTLADANMAWLEASGQDLLASWSKITQEFGKRRDEVLAANLAPTDEQAALERLRVLEQVAKTQAGFDAQLKEAADAMSFYEQQIAKLESRIQTGVATEADRRRLTEYRAAITTLVSESVPKLEELRNALARIFELQGLSPEQVTAALAEVDRALEKFRGGGRESGFVSLADQARETDNALTGFRLGLQNSANQILSWGQVGYQAAGQVTEAISRGGAEAFTSWIQGTEDAGDVFRGFVANVLTGIAQMIVQMMIMRAIQAGMSAFGWGGGAAAGAGAARGGVVPRFATGGVYQPWEPATFPRTADDRYLVAVRGGEGFIRPEAVDFYGPQMVAAINRMMLPSSLFSGAVGRVSRPALAFAGGGVAGPARGPRGGQQPVVIDNQVVVALTSEDRAKLAATSEFAAGVMATIRVNASEVRRIASTSTGFSS